MKNHRNFTRAPTRWRFENFCGKKMSGFWVVFWQWFFQGASLIFHWTFIMSMKHLTWKAMDKFSELWANLISHCAAMSAIAKGWWEESNISYGFLAQKFKIYVLLITSKQICTLRSAYHSSIVLSPRMITDSGRRANCTGVGTLLAFYGMK